jgi:hypothetical protein
VPGFAEVFRNFLIYKLMKIGVVFSDAHRSLLQCRGRSSAFDKGKNALSIVINLRNRGGTVGVLRISCSAFSQPDIDGYYFTETEYAMLYGLAPNIQNAFEELDKAA